jgi:hypothetical protein
MSDNNFREGMRWLKQAESDFKSAKYLSKGGFYSESVFHTQQAAEKALKGYSIKIFQDLKKPAKNLTGTTSPPGIQIHSQKDHPLIITERRSQNYV